MAHLVDEGSCVIPLSSVFVLPTDVCTGPRVPRLLYQRVIVIVTAGLRGQARGRGGRGRGGEGGSRGGH